MWMSVLLLVCLFFLSFYLVVISTPSMELELTTPGSEVVRPTVGPGRCPVGVILLRSASSVRVCGSWEAISPPSKSVVSVARAPLTWTFRSRPVLAVVGTGFIPLVPGG